jgi:hypothetical protein
MKDHLEKLKEQGINSQNREQKRIDRKRTTAR